MNIKQIGLTAILTFILIAAGLIIYQNAQTDKTLTISTTTSVDNTGVLGDLIGEFTSLTGIEVKVIAKGSGVAVGLGIDGEVDAILVHAPALEEEFMANGNGENRTTLWYNYFLIAGPSSDPAGIASATNASEAMNKIRTAGQEGTAKFYSRGDNSGTHIKELGLWDIAPDASTDDWYVETGTGMSSTITTANEEQGYVLTDFGTFAQLEAAGTINLVSLFAEDNGLYNPYSYLVVSSEKYPDLQTENAYEFLDFLLSQKALDIVNSFVIGTNQLFTPITE